MDEKKRKNVRAKFISDEEVPSKIVELKAKGNIPASKERNKKKVEGDLECIPEETTFSVQNKPTSLFESGDVTGQEIFGFQTPKRRNAMTNRVLESTDKTPKTPLQEKVQISVQKTPSSAKSLRTKHLQPSPLSRKVIKKDITSEFSSPSQNKILLMNDNRTPKSSKKLIQNNETIKQNSVCPQTPYNLRRKFKKKLAAVSMEEKCDSGGSEREDFSDSGSEWDEDSKSESFEGESGSGNESEGGREEATPKMMLPKKKISALPGHIKNLHLSFVPAAEEYFQTHASKKILTSNHTLGKLRHNLPQEKLQKLLSETVIMHGKQLEKLQKNVYSLFSKWHFLLREGFNILLYGVGSKQLLLNSFCQQIEEPSVVVNGFFPSLTIQEILSSIAEDILNLRGPSGDLEIVDSIRRVFSCRRNAHLFLIVHNIDGVMLRNYKKQEVLASLADIPNIHLIASIDHINAPIMWDQKLLGMFNFSWWDTTTFQPYVIETAFESSLLVQQSGNLALSSLQNVFRSLTSNAKNIFLLMAEYQKEHKNESNYSGMPFKKLYNLCRESLLVSSDLALRSQLTEFLDHRLVKSRRGYDGSELLIIPMDITLLDQFVSQESVFNL